MEVSHQSFGKLCWSCGLQNRRNHDNLKLYWLGSDDLTMCSANYCRTCYEQMLRDGTAFKGVGMSQEELAAKLFSAERVDSLITVQYKGSYIHCGVYDGEFICHVHFNYGVEYFSSSLVGAKRFVTKMRKGLGYE